jgi:hypothetical protein
MRRWRPQGENFNGRRVSPDLPATVVAVVTVVIVVAIIPMITIIRLLYYAQAISRRVKASCLTQGGGGVCSDSAESESNCSGHC